MNFERESLETEALPEYVREGKGRLQDSLEFLSTKPQSPTKPQNSIDSLPPANEPEAPQTDVLEALWPGVHQEFSQPVRRLPSFYLTIGFMVGAAVSLVAVWIFSVVPGMISSWTKWGTTGSVTKTIKEPDSFAASPAVMGESINPAQPAYQVQDGDTLAAIALSNYKRVSPRLLDAICRANNMKSADVLVLGQRLVLPVYHPLTSSSQSRVDNANPANSQASGR